MLVKVISGGQTGADIAGLDAAKEEGIPTGGWATKGWRTDVGPRPGLAEYGLVESESKEYPARTILNVRDSDGTVWFGKRSPGFTCTSKAWEFQGKPWILDPDAKELASWIKEKGIRVLNVAGNRERKHPGIYDYVRGVVGGAIRLLKGRDDGF